MRKRGISKVKRLSHSEKVYLEDTLENLRLILRTMGFDCDFVLTNQNGQYTLAPRLKSDKGVRVSQDGAVAYTHTNKVVPEKFVKSLAKNLIETGNILNENHIPKVIFGTGGIIEGYLTTDGYYLECEQVNSTESTGTRKEENTEETIPVQMFVNGVGCQFTTTPSRFYHDISKKMIEQTPPCKIEIRTQLHGYGMYTYVLKGKKPDSPRFIKRDISNYDIPVHREKRRTLKCIDPKHNHYKYYTIWHDRYETHVEYGRVGSEGMSSPSERQFQGSYTYPEDMYWVKYYEKVAKGYRDYTKNAESERINTDGNQEEGSTCRIYPSKSYENLYTYLKNYTETVLRGCMTNEARDSITTKDIVDARRYLTRMAKVKDVGTFNKILKEVLLLIPRQSAHIQDFFADKDEDFQRILDRESDLLKALEGIVVGKDTKPKTKKEYDPLGCKIEPLSDKDKAIVSKALDFEEAYRDLEMVEAYKITDSRVFNPNGYTTRMLWHGSRTENWISILSKGLTVSPVSGVITSGSMLGAGLYFAPNPYKSFGYTSQTNAYWTRGDFSKANYGVMALCEVAVGRSYTPTEAKRFSKSWLHSNGYQSIWAIGHHTRMSWGYCLENDEVVVYEDNQVKIRYIVLVREK